MITKEDEGMTPTETRQKVQSLKEVLLGPDPSLHWYQRGSGVAASAFFASFIASMFLVLLGIVPLTWTSEGIIGIFFLLGFLSAMAASK